MTSLDDFCTNHPNGSRVGDDSLVGHGETERTKFQCVSLVKAYLRECYGLNPGAWGNAIDYWSGTHPILLSLFPRIQSSDAVKGDIVILRTLGRTDYSGSGHIGISTGNVTRTQVEILEQNGSTGGGTGTGGDAIRTRYVDRARVAGLLRPISVVQAPAPIPQPIPSGNAVHLPATVATWAIYHEGTSYRKGTSDQKGTLTPQKYGGLTYPIKGWIGDSAVVIDTESYGRGVIWVKGTDAQFVNLTPPQAPYVPPAPKYEAPPAERYIVKTRLMRFDRATDALTHSNVTGDLEPSSDPKGYFVIAKLHEAYNLSDNNMYDRNWWVNTKDNAILPEPVLPTPAPIPDPLPELPPVVAAPIEPAYQPTPLQYQMITPLELTYTGDADQSYPDLEGKTTQVVKLTPGRTNTYTMMVEANDELCYIPEASMKKGYRHGIPETVLQAQHKPLDRNGDGVVNLGDFTDGLQDFIDYGGKLFSTTKTVIYKAAANPEIREKATKFIDGFTKKKGK